MANATARPKLKVARTGGRPVNGTRTTSTADQVADGWGTSARRFVRSNPGRHLGNVGIFAIGLLVGAGAALLLAPTSGQGLREGLADRLRRAREGVADENDDSDVPEEASPQGEART